MKLIGNFQNEMPIRGSRKELWTFISTLQGYLSFFAESGTETGQNLVMEYGGLTNRVELIVLRPWHVLYWKHAYEIGDKQYPLETTFTITGQEPCLLLTVEVTGFGAEPDDLFVRDLMDETWVRTLLNLKSIIEVGIDIREPLFGYPRLGIRSTGTGVGNLVIACLPGGRAEVAGIRAGDMILAVEGRRVNHYKELVRELAWQSGRKQVVTLELERAGAGLEVKVNFQ